MGARVGRRLVAIVAVAVAVLATGCVTPSGGGPPPPPKVIEVGGSHTCAVDSGRQVACWGRNNYGQLGIGTFVNSEVPLYVPGMSSVTAVTGSFGHSCAIKAGEVWCWGFNNSGQLGDGTTTNRPSPVKVAGLSGITAVSAALGHTCAVGAEVYCWGANAAGQLGDGTTTGSPTPVTVVGLAGATSVSVKGTHSCARTAAGEARCWGANGAGELGDGTTTNSSVPVAPVGLGIVDEVQAGTQNSCARFGPAVACWGDNSNGQLGDGTTTASLVPVPVQGLASGVSRLATGAFHSCVAVGSGAAQCWGRNVNGQLGDGTTTNSLEPVDVIGLTSVTYLTAGLGHTCAVMMGTLLMCWGNDGAGQLGSNAATGQSSVPVAVEEPVAPPPVVPPGNITTESSYDLDCQAYLGATPVQTNLIATDTSVSHPPAVDPGESFRVVISGAEVDVPLTQQGFNLLNMSNFVNRFSLPANATVVTASYVPGVNTGVGTPTVTDGGTYVQLTTPGPLAPGTTATLPSIVLDMQATGLSGETIDFDLPGTGYGDWDYSFNVSVETVGIVANRCFVDPSPVLASITIN